MKICENCSEEHDGSFASGRFCSRKCGYSFSTKNKRKEINVNVSKKLKGSGNLPVDLICEGCGKSFIANYNRRNQKMCSRSCSGRKAGNSIDFSKVNWSQIHKKSYSEGRIVAGGTTKWLQYKDIKVQGSYELRACELLDEMIEKKEIVSWSYGKIRIPYIGEDKKTHTYIVDFLIKTPFKEKLLEVKGREVNNDHLKWEAARNLGWELEIWRKEYLFNTRA